MGDIQRKDFIVSAVATLSAFALVLGSLNIYARANEPMYKSPALLPLLVSVALLGVSLILLVKSFRSGGLVARVKETGEWLSILIRAPFARNTLAGLIVMAIYVFLLLPRLPFWVSSIAFLIAIFALLRAGKWWAMVTLSGGLVGAIYLLFSIVLRAPLP